MYAALPLRLGYVQDGLGPFRACTLARAEARSAAVIHAGDSVEDLRKFTRQVRDGRIPDNPYLVIGQQSLPDPSRAPAGGHTLWAYSRVPPRLERGWDTEREAFADRMEHRIEGLALDFGGSFGRVRFSRPPIYRQ